jgi:hypothetical protein
MIQVRLLTESQKESLTNKQFKPNCTFNPIQDNNDNWIISNEEVVQCINPTVMWVNELPLIEWIKPIDPELE